MLIKGEFGLSQDPHPNPLPEREREQEKFVLLPYPTGSLAPTAPCGRRGIAQGAFKKGGCSLLPVRVGYFLSRIDVMLKLNQWISGNYYAKYSSTDFT